MEIPSVKQLIEAARQAVNARDDQDLATVLRQRYGLRTSQSSISRWRDAPRGPGFESTYALLSLAGWLNEDRVAAAQHVDAAAREAEEGERQARDVPLRPPLDERETG